MTLPIAILAGGFATRMRPLTERVPKVLLEVAGRPFAEHQLQLLLKGGIRDVVFCVGHLGEMVERELGDGSRFGMSIRYSYDGDTLRGTGGALVRALPLLGEAFLVMYGDSYLDCDYAAVERQFVESGKLGLMAIIRNEGRWDRSNVLYESGRIVRYDKKNRTPEMLYIDYGLGALRREALAKVPADQVIDLADIYHELSLKNELAAFEMTERFYEIGSPRGLQETDAYIRLHMRVSGRGDTAPRGEDGP